MTPARDNTLLPTQVTRLCALGTLRGQGDLTYGALAGEVRSVTAHLIGTAPTVTASSIELLRYEGLIHAVGLDDPVQPTGPDTVLRLTDAGRRAFEELMAGGLTTPLNELNRLAVQLRLAFLHLLEETQRDAVRMALIALYEREIDRVSALYEDLGHRPGPLGAWLKLDLEHAMDRLNWLKRAAQAHRWAAPV